MKLPTQEELVKKAEKIILVAKEMDETFNAKFSKEHLKLVIMAGLIDIYKQGYSDEIKPDIKSSKIANDYATLLTLKQWEKFKKKFRKHFNYGGMSIHIEDVLKYIYEELLIKTI